MADERPAADRRAARVGVGAGQDQRAAAELHEAARAADVVAPDVVGREAAPGRVHRDGDRAVEGAVAVGGGEQVDAVVAQPVVEEAAGGQFGGRDHVAALRRREVGEAGREQRLRPHRDHRRPVRGPDRRQAVGQARRVGGLVARVVGEAVGGRIHGRVGAPLQGTAAGLAQVALRLREGLAQQGRVRRVVERPDGEGGRQHAAADHVGGRMHARLDPVVAELARAGEQFLEPLRDRVGQGEGRQVGGVGVAAREAAIRRGGRAPLRPEGGRHDESEALAVQALPPGARIAVGVLGRAGGGVGPERVDQLHDLPEGRRRHAGAGALVDVLDARRGRVEGRDRGGRPRSRQIGPGQRPEAVDDAVALVSAVVVVGGDLLRLGPLPRPLGDDLDVAQQEGRPEGRGRSGVVGLPGDPDPPETRQDVDAVAGRLRLGARTEQRDRQRGE